MNINDYEILPVPELKIRLKQESRDLFEFDYQMKHNHAYVYYLRSGQVILMPNNLYDKQKGIIFKNRQVFDKYAVMDRFPIENENASIEEIFQPEILGVGKNITEIVSYLSDFYGLDSSSTTLPQILIKAQERTGAIKISHKEYMYATLLLGEYIRKSVNGKWILLKEYGTFNPYYTPAIINTNNSIVILLYVSDLYFDANEYSLKDFLRYPSVKEPSLKFGSKIFNNSFSEYKIID